MNDWKYYLELFCKAETRADMERLWKEAQLAWFAEKYGIDVAHEKLRLLQELTDEMTRRADKS